MGQSMPDPQCLACRKRHKFWHVKQRQTAKCISASSADYRPAGDALHALCADGGQQDHGRACTGHAKPLEAQGQVRESEHHVSLL